VRDEMIKCNSNNKDRPSARPQKHFVSHRKPGAVLSLLKENEHENENQKNL
jgi:hypothetical protein